MDYIGNKNPLRATTDAPPSDATIASRLLSLGEAVRHATGVLATTAERVADQIAGSHPDKEAVMAKPSPVPNGLYDELGVVLENLQAALHRIDVALGRASNKLG